MAPTTTTAAATTSQPGWDTDPKQWKGLIPDLPGWQPPLVSGKDVEADYKVLKDSVGKQLESISTRVQTSIKTKLTWLLCPTNNIRPTGRYLAGNTYDILTASQRFIAALNEVPNHDPAAKSQTQQQPKSGDDTADPLPSGETAADLLAFITAIRMLESVTDYDETVSQDPDGTGRPADSTTSAQPVDAAASGQAANGTTS